MHIYVSVHTQEIKELKSSLQALEVEFCINNANIYPIHQQDALGSRCLKGETAYSKDGEHCLGGKHGNQASANHPALSYWKSSVEYLPQRILTYSGVGRVGAETSRYHRSWIAMIRKDQQSEARQTRGMHPHLSPCRPGGHPARACLPGAQPLTL